MYAVSQTYWNDVWLPARQLSIRAEIDGTVVGSESQVLDMHNIKSCSVSEKLMNESKFEIGNAVMRTLSISFFDETGSIAAVGLGGATLDLYFGLNGTEVFYSRFYINETYTKGIQVQCECVDAMAFADIPYISTLSLPASLYLVAQEVADKCGLTLIDATIPNGSIEISVLPENVSCRQMLQYIAQITGSNAKIKRTQGKDVTFAELEVTGKTIPNTATFKIEVAENPVNITGVTYGQDYVVGTTAYAISLNSNPILDSLGSETITQILNTILSKYSTLSYYPSKANINLNAAFESGDIVSLTDKNGNEYLTIISQINATGTSQMRIVGSGATKEQNKYVTQGILSGRVAEILREVSLIETDLIPQISQAIIDASEKITGAISGHIYIPEADDPYGLSTGQILIMDAATPDEAINVWRWNLNGLGFSDSGVNGTFETAITQDGQIVANFITAGIMNASVIKTGTLASTNNASWIDLDNGTFNLGNGSLVYDGTTLNIQKQIDDATDRLDEQSQYIKIDPSEPSITIGTSENGANIKVEDDVLTLNGADNTKATLKSSKFNVDQIQTKKQYFGTSCAWVLGENGHLSLKKVN